jgi:radical SAM protein with 4Fe4S-binding SPASM domain
MANHCWKLQHANVITWDGLVVPCCFDKDATHRLGDLRQQSFREIWNSHSYKAFRARLSASRKNIDICSNCSEGVSVWKD